LVGTCDQKLEEKYLLEPGKPVMQDIPTQGFESIVIYAYKVLQQASWWMKHLVLRVIKHISEEP
jgi:hypothetical protein